MFQEEKQVYLIQCGFLTERLWERLLEERVLTSDEIEGVMLGLQAGLCNSGRGMELWSLEHCQPGTVIGLFNSLFSRNNENSTSIILEMDYDLYSK